jgi:hypothetical protein
MIWSTIAAILAALGASTVGVSLYRSNKFKKKKNEELTKANQEITQQKKMLEAKNKEIAEAYEELNSTNHELHIKNEIIALKNHEINDSINYAQRIQQSVLPDLSVINKPRVIAREGLTEAISEDKIASPAVRNDAQLEAFVLFKPKDVVSGDFYWLAEVEDKKIISVADCTGHGVPGAFMSLVGISQLNEIVKKEYITHTGVILNKLRKNIIATLGQNTGENKQKDGMDIAIVSIDTQEMKLQYSAAYNSLLFIRNGEISELDADKMPVGVHERMDKFTATEIDIQSGDQFYLFSDGFPDQFGGPKGKKFMYKKFKELVLANSNLSMEEQKQVLDKAITDWMAYINPQNNQPYEQTDDITVVGISI